MEAFEGAVEADELRLVVIKTLHLDRMVESHLLDRWGAVHGHVWVGESGQKVRKSPSDEQAASSGAFFGKRMPAMA